MIHAVGWIRTLAIASRYALLLAGGEDFRNRSLFARRGIGGTVCPNSASTFWPGSVPHHLQNSHASAGYLVACRTDIPENQPYPIRPAFPFGIGATSHGNCPSCRYVATDHRPCGCSAIRPDSKPVGFESGNAGVGMITCFVCRSAIHWIVSSATGESMVDLVLSGVRMSPPFAQIQYQKSPR